jgi:Bacterial protein of unknown function (DUF937)
MNIVSTAMQFLTPMITNKIASALGISPGLVTTAIGALIPGLLGGIVSKSATPAGAGSLFDLLGKQDPNLLGSFASMLGGPGQQSMISGGTNAMSSLLGGSATSALAGAVGKFAGIDGAQSNNLMGMLAPVLLGQLAQTTKSSGLDASGLAKMLDGQKSNIAAALPGGFASMLGGSGLLDGVTGSVKAAAPTVPKVEMPKMPSMPSSEGFNWMPWAGGAAALAALFYLFGGMGSSKPPVVVAPAKTTAPAVAVSPAAATEALAQARSIVAGLTTSLGGIKDAATAQAALPQLTASSTGLDTLTKLAGTLSPEMRTPITAMIASALPSLAPMIANVLKIPGAEAILKPVLDGIMTKMTGLSK